MSQSLAPDALSSTSLSDGGDSAAARSRDELLRRRLAGRGGARRAEIPRADRSAPLPLSFGQEQMWFLDQLTPGSTEYLVPVALRLRGAVDAAALADAWDLLVARHEILRTRHVLVEGRPAQVVDDPRTGLLRAVDVDGGDGVAELVAAESALPLDLAEGWPARATLARVADDDHLLLVVLHHIACDAWSSRLLLAELGAAYAALCAGQSPQLPPLPVQYADFAAWQRAQLTPVVRERQLGYWRDALSGIGPLELPTDRPRPAVRGYAGAECDFVLPPEVGVAVREVAAAHATTPFVVLMAAFQALLARYTGRPDVAVGTVVSGRTRPELQGLIGYGINTLVIRSRWSADVSFATLLGHVREIVLDAFDHGTVPFAHVVDELQPRRDLSRTPLFQAVFTLHESAGVAGEFAPGLRVEPSTADGGVARCDLELQVVPAADGSMRARLIYATELFDAATARRLARHLTALLGEVTADPARPLSRVEILDDAERAALTRPAAAMPDADTALRRFDQQVAACPEAAAVVTDDGATSYAELAARVNRLAGRLRAAGAGPEQVVGILLDRGVDLIAAMLACWRVGAAYLPIGPELPPQRWGHLLADCSVRVALTQPDRAERVGEVFDGRVMVVDGDHGGPVAPVPDAPGVVDLDSLAYVIYTSGSTGSPKGVAVTHRGLVNHLDWVVAEYIGDHPGGAPLFSTVASDVVVPVLFGPLVAGRPVHVLPQDVDIAELGPRLAAAKPFGFVKLTPSHLEVLGHQLGQDELRGLAGSVVAGGDVLLDRVARRWDDWLGDGRVVNEYGPTEITVGNSVFVPAGTPPREVVPIGHPIPHTSMYVLDEWLRPTPVGVIGEVCVGGAGVARGYVGRPAATAEKFVPDPFGPPGSRLYRTGDLGRVLPDGAVEFAGRADGQVKIRGYRVELGEIEGVLAGHPAVAENRVLLRADDEHRRLVAYVVPAADTDLDAEALRGWLGQRLAEYMVPASVVALDRIPLTANGKLDVAALPAPAAPDTEHVTPRTDLEQRMAALWEQVLGVDRVGALDGFFDLGGDSIRAVALVGAMREAGMDVAVRDVFAHGTVAALAELVDGRDTVQAETSVAPFALVEPADRALAPAGVVDMYPLSRNQTGMVFEMLADDQNRYHNVTSFRIRDAEPFSLTAMTAAARLIAERHEALRTSLHLSGFSAPMQLVHDHAELPVLARDLTGLAPARVEQILRAHSDLERQTLFDLETPGLMRFFAHLTGDDGYWLTVTECHPILEGWGHHSMMMEFLDAYDRIRAGAEPAPHDPPPVRFADFVAEELAAIGSPEHAAYWRDVVTEHTPFTPPQAWADDTVGPNHRHQATVQWRDLEPALRAAATDAGVSLKCVMVSAFVKVLAQLTDDDAFHFGLICDARPERRGADRVYGMYLNTLPFAAHRPSGTWRQLLRATFDREVELWPHRRYPYPEIARLTHGRGRLVNAIFNYQDFNQVDTDLVDDRAGADDSPTEFPLSVSSRVGMIFVTVDPAVIAPDHADLVARSFRLVLEAIAADVDGDATTVRLPREHLWQLLDAARTTVRPTVEQVADAVTHTMTAIERQAARTPHAIAVRCGQQRITFAELDERADALARRLRATGFGPGHIAGVVATRDAALLVSLLATWKAGGAYLPLGPELPPERLAYLLEDCAASCVLLAADQLDRVPATNSCVAVLVDGTDIPAATDQPWPDRDPDALAYLIYTSGSTGRPKGVAITHANLASYLSWAVADYTAHGIGGAPLFSTPAADLVVTTLFTPLLVGQPVHVVPQDTDLTDLGQAILDGGPYAFVKLAPGHLDVLAGQLDPDRLRGLAGTLVVGGDMLHGPLARRWADAVGARVVNEYGPTEITVGNSVQEVGGAPRAVVPIGKPVPRTTMHVLDPCMQPVPMGVVGEVCVGGAGVAMGYAGRPDLTADRFVPDPFGPPGSRLYRTGDLGRVLPDGAVDLVGRRDGQVKIRGYRVEVAEVESVLAAHPLVAETKVVARDGALVAYVVAPPGAQPTTPEQLRRWLGHALPDYMVPSVFQPLPRLPLTPNGKVDTRALPDPDPAAAGADYVEPSTPMEKRVADIWRQVLDLGRVGVDDVFFDVGGDSIRAVRLAGALRTSGLAVTVRELFDHPTVARLSSLLTDRTPDRFFDQPR